MLIPLMVTKRYEDTQINKDPNRDKTLARSTPREHHKLMGKTISLGKNCSFYCLECCQYSESEFQATEKTVW